jgi:hypothetical protein
VGWDFFVSYTAADQAWAEWVAWELEAAGYQVLFQTWDFVPGSHWMTRMGDGIAGAERTLAILSSAYLKSVYGRAEWQAAYRADPRGLRRKLIPVRVEDCDRPGLLGEVVSFDLFDCSVEDARLRLHGKISEALAGRAKPPTAPAFPARRPQTRPRPLDSSALRPPQQAPPSTAPHFPGQPTASRGAATDWSDSPGRPPPRAGTGRHRALTWVFTLLASTFSLLTRIFRLLLVVTVITIAVITIVNLVEWDTFLPASPGAAQPTTSGRPASPQRTTPKSDPISPPPPQGVLAQETLRMKSPDVADLEQGLVGTGVTDSDLYLFCSAGQCLLNVPSGEATTEGPRNKATCAKALRSRHDISLDLSQLNRAMKRRETLCVQTNEFHIAALRILGIPEAGTSELVFSYTLWR